MIDRIRLDIAREQLRRLGTLTDCVYAVSLILVIQWLPLPSESLGPSKGVWLRQLFAEHAQNLIAVLIGIVFITLYWIRSTDLSARLGRTDSVHATFSILSVFALLFLLYIVRISEEVVPQSRRAGESIAVALIGIAAGLAFVRARKKGLARVGISDDEMEAVQIKALTEPLTALITLPFAFVGELWWNLAWFAWLPLAKILSNRLSRFEALGGAGRNADADSTQLSTGDES